MDYPNVESVSEDQLRAEIMQLETDWPQFVGLKPTDLCRCCGMGCTTERARERWGDEAARAWHALSNTRWLLGED